MNVAAHHLVVQAKLMTETVAVNAIKETIIMEPLVLVRIAIRRHIHGTTINAGTTYRDVLLIRPHYHPGQWLN